MVNYINVNSDLTLRFSGEVILSDQCSTLFILILLSVVVLFG